MSKLAGFFLFFLSFSLAFGRNGTILLNSNLLNTPEVFKEIQNQNRTGNLMFSSFSLELALLFLEAGCKGETAQEILDAYHLGLVSNEAIANDTKVQFSSLTSCKKYTFKIANGIFVQKNYTIRDNFKKNATEVFYAKTQNVDFANNTETAKIINSWIEGQTKNTIQDLVDPSSLNGLTRLVLANALYFEGNWTIPFPPMYTKKGVNFYKTPTDIIQVNMMALEGKTFEYAHCSSLKAGFLKLPIIGENASMIIVLPTEKDGLANLEQYPKKIFTPRHFRTQAVDVRLPKFSFRSTFNLSCILKQLGVVKAFDPVQADLSGIAGRKGDLFLSDVIQKTYIQVAENGIVAAAATAVDVSTTAIVVPPPDTIQFICDHPFIFYIEIEDFIMFSGRVVDPNQSD